MLSATLPKLQDKRKDTKVTTYCPKCKKYMCIGSCFEKYHTLVDYKHLACMVCEFRNCNVLHVTIFSLCMLDVHEWNLVWF